MCYLCRMGKTVLVQHRNFYDADYAGSYSIKTYTSKKTYAGSYSIKTYTSKKTYDDLGNWSHEEIVLQPKNPEFSPIVIHEDEADEFRVIGEFVGCLPKVGMSRDPQ